VIVRLLISKKKSSFHKIVGPSSPQSMAQYLLLKHSYQVQDRDYKILRNYKRIWLNFRNRVLRNRQKAAKGKLVCHYCGSGYLVTNFQAPGVKSRFKATLDHVVPRSRGGGDFDEANLVVCCHQCNQRKKDLLPNQFQSKKV
jgi:5-methylcytosine-specific restriction endonuclease McrA